MDYLEEAHDGYESFIDAWETGRLQDARISIYACIGAALIAIAERLDRVIDTDTGVMCIDVLEK